MKLSRLLCLLPVLALAAAPCVTRAQSSPPPERAAWMKSARWGVMSHYLADWRERTDQENRGIEHWNNLIDHFDVEKLADQLKFVGASYYLISIGQNSGYYLAPNPTYDKLTGIAPSKLSRRDLVADLAAALGKRGIKLMVYLPSGAPGGDRAARTALKWENGPGAFPNIEFQKNWEAVIRDWSLRWGDKVAGWWFDGCYWPNTMYRRAEAPNFASFAAAARAGNPQSAVAFNPGVIYRTVSITPEEDYIAGEIDKPELWTPKRNVDGKIDGVQIHVLSYLGEKWGMGAPRFSNQDAVSFSQKVIAVDGAITWDTPTQKDGTFAPEFIDQLRAIGQAMAAGKSPAAR
jgi:hypothetical protein